MGSDHSGTGDHETVCLRRVVDCVGVPERLHIGVNVSSGGGPGGVHTGLITVPN